MSYNMPGSFRCHLHNLKCDKDFKPYWKYHREILIGVSKAALFRAQQTFIAKPESIRDLEIAYAQHEVLETFDHEVLH